MTKRRINQVAPVAGGGLLDRRLFLQQGLRFSAITVAGSSSIQLSAANAAESAAPEMDDQGRLPWMNKPGLPFTNYGQPSPHEKEVVRWISANTQVPGNGISWSPLQDLEGMITPNGLHFERHHNGIPEIDPAQHRLIIHGLVDQPLQFSIADLLRYPMQSRICFVECGGNSNAGWNKQPIQTAVGWFHGLASCSEWSGVPLRLLLEEAGIQSQAKWLVAEAADAIRMNISIPVAKAMDDCLLALYQNGERLRPEQGYPLRLLAPGYEGVLNVKWLHSLRASAKPVMARNETSKYTELLPNGKARMFTFFIEAKSVITRPSFGMQLSGPGLYEISGLAWSGRGKVTRVEVSADGGETWADAALAEPVLPKAFTRFRIPWRWDGGKTVLQSRATDESGYVQPARKTLVAERGRHGYFHYNAIVSWEVDDSGLLSHVYVDSDDTEADPFSNWDDWG